MHPRKPAKITFFYYFADQILEFLEFREMTPKLQINFIEIQILINNLNEQMKLQKKVSDF